MILNNQNHEFYMSNITGLPKRIVRWAVFTTILACGIFALAGRWLDPWLWVYVAMFSAVGLYAALNLDDDLARERFRPAEPGADRVPLKAIRLIALAHVIVGALDYGRWHLAEVSEGLRFAGLVGTMLTLPLVFSAMLANRFFSPVVRIQKERGHRVVDRGPYAVVRHPGYVGMITSIPFSALVLGSWIGFALAAAYSILIFRRVLFEDAFLRANLEGYAAYAERVRYRLVPRVW
jgi:protein-S-isoprenylcysteine O-methyltransferase Ste14